MTREDLIQSAKNLLQKRKQAYQHVFNPENQFLKYVLADLAKFCRANDTTFHPNPQVQAELEGRREVWLRICNYTKLDPDELWKVYGRKDNE